MSMITAQDRKFGSHDMKAHTRTQTQHKALISAI